MSVPTALSSAIATTETRPRMNAYSTSACPLSPSRRVPARGGLRSATSIILTRAPRLERRLERVRDAGQQRRDVGADRAQQSDRDDGDEAENECVLDQCLTLLGLVAAADQSD